MRIACLIAITISAVLSARNDLHPLSDEFIDYVNSQQNTWTAGRNFEKNTSLSHIRGLLGTLKYPESVATLKVLQHTEDVEIPDTFDARENWPDCEIIRLIKDQSACGSCWAVAAASAMSDRICIHTNGTRQLYVSDEDLLSCCHSCGFGGCMGGYPIMAWYYWNQTGISSGGPYNSTKGCKAYSMPPCSGTETKCPEDNYDAPECTTTCDLGSSIDYQSDKSYGQSPYYVDSDEKQIQLEIFKNGPVEASFIVYDDFVSYKSGVYQQVSDVMEGGHAVRIIGWGVEKDTPYWLVVNSWNVEWGDNGLFKIIRGRNECGIEEDIVAGLPKL